MASKYMKATIELLIEVENDELEEARAADTISETLRPLLRAYGDAESPIIDWRYAAGGPEGYQYAKRHSGGGFEHTEDAA